MQNGEKDIKKLENKIIKDKDAESICQFARDMKGANIEKLQEEIIKIKDAKYIYEFARDVKGANIKKLQDVIIDCIEDLGIYEVYVSKFIKDVKGVDIQSMVEKMLKKDFGDHITCKVINDHVKDLNIVKLENRIIQIKDIWRLRYFANTVKYINAEKINTVANKLEYEESVSLTR